MCHPNAPSGEWRLRITILKTQYWCTEGAREACGITSDRGSTFILCARWKSDRRYPKYPIRSVKLGGAIPNRPEEARAGFQPKTQIIELFAFVRGVEAGIIRVLEFRGRFAVFFKKSKNSCPAPRSGHFACPPIPLLSSAVCSSPLCFLSVVVGKTLDDLNLDIAEVRRTCLTFVASIINIRDTDEIGRLEGQRLQRHEQQQGLLRRQEFYGISLHGKLIDSPARVRSTLRPGATASIQNLGSCP